MASLLTGRYGFAITNIGHHLYAIGGRNRKKHNVLQTSERYNLFTDRWTELDCLLPDEFSMRITVGVSKKRVIYGFGGEDNSWQTCEEERVLCLDTAKSGWKIIPIQIMIGSLCGVIPLQQND